MLHLGLFLVVLARRSPTVSMTTTRPSPAVILNRRRRIPAMGEPRPLAPAVQPTNLRYD
jgi:hypothetical protein